MISAIQGELRHLEEGRAHVACGAFLFEVMVPAADVGELSESVGREVMFHTLFYLEGDPSRGGLEPKLIGFLRAADRRFFELFTTVKGIGARTALRALERPIGQIAYAIETKDARYLTQLKGIGKRTAELIVAELSGKAAAFATATEGSRAPAVSGLGRQEEDAVAALVALGERRADAEALLARVRQLHPNLTQTDNLVREMLQMRGVR